MCLFPIKASHQPDGGRPLLHPEGELRLPCGKCKECISKRALEWATRARHEISDHKENSFITLTYAPEHLKSNFIIKSDFQKFIKRLRKKQKTKLRYMVSYEYGTESFRPHMHAIIFGYNPPKQTKIQENGGNPLFTSPEIEQLWDKGFHSIGTANEKTAYYIAAYALKGTGYSFEHTDQETGEIKKISNSMDVSKRPAIGLKFLINNAEQLVNSGEILPRYYLKSMEPENVPKLLKRFPQLENKIRNLPELLEQAQNNVAENITNRSSGELYAKFVIDTQKNSQSRTYYRGTGQMCEKNSQENRANKFYHQRLKQDRDNYVAHNKEK